MNFAKISVKIIGNMVGFYGKVSALLKFIRDSVANIRTWTSVR